jgi:hypothetical protein
MKQFDICRLRSNSPGLVVNLQSDHSADLSSLVVAPLIAAMGLPSLTNLHVEVMLDAERHLLQVDRLAAMPRKALGEVVGSVGSEQNRIKRAIDFLFYGF